MRKVYLDYAATTPTHPEVVEAMSPYFTEVFGNPSSLYSCGQEAKKACQEARSKVAALIGASEEEVVFTGGGTEADNFALKGVALAKESRLGHIITSSIEHHAVIETVRFLEKMGFTVTYLPVDEYGMVHPDQARAAVTDKTILISIMQANNEVGTIEPLAEIGKIAKERGVYFHTDAVQTAGHIPIDVNALGVDLLSMSAHKLYGPKGIGALYVRKGTRLMSYMHGGEQEGGRRAGTENVPGIVGFGKAAELAQQGMVEEIERLTSLRDHLIKGIFERLDHVHLNGHPVKRLPNNVSFIVDFIEGQAICLNLDLEGVCAATGSACSSASFDPSHVLLAMGISREQAQGSVRFTLGKWTTDEDIERVLEILPRIVARLRAMSPLFRGPPTRLKQGGSSPH